MHAIQFLFFTSAVTSIAGYFLSNSYAYGLCASDFSKNIWDVSCHYLYESIGNPLLYGGISLALVFLAVLIFPKSVRVWKIFAIWYLPLATALFLVSRDPGSGDLFSPYPEQIYQWVGGLYVLLGLLIVLIYGTRNGSVEKGSGPIIKNRYLQVLWYVYVAWVIVIILQGFFS